MRKFTFQGKRRDNGKIITGSYLYLNTYGYDWKGERDGKKTEVHYIVDEYGTNIAVHPESVELISA
jgi:hypothetical protein